MDPHSQGLRIDVDALSGICGSISIACWIVVFSPQIIENFRRHSADGLSLIFIVVWLLGDVFNILGAVLQGVIPTMTILAVYYTLADMVLLAQCFYYRGFTLSDPTIKVDEEAVEEEDTEETPLLSRENEASSQPTPPSRPTIADADGSRRSSSFSSLKTHLHKVDATHLSPATPLIPLPNSTATPSSMVSKTRVSAFRTLLLNTSALLLVCLAGVLGWFLSTRSSHRGQPPNHHHHHYDPIPSLQRETSEIRFDIWGQIFGYLCAVLYLASRVPQLLLNYRRKSVEGVSMLFFLFACIGNLTYVMSIFAYSPSCQAKGWCDYENWWGEYGRYVLVNLSWLIGSAGTLVLDMLIFGQFWVYRASSDP